MIASMRWVLGAGCLVVAACGAEEAAPAGGVAPPVVGDIGPVPAGTGAAAKRERPKLMRSTAKPDAPAAPPAASGSAAAKEMPATMTEAELASFVAKIHCNMPKLGTCSSYGSKYPRIEAMEGICGRLGGNIVPACPTDGLVARCLTGADVLTHYYAGGDKPHTKEDAEAKCTERKWSIVR